MRFKYLGFHLLIALVLTFSIASCQDDWENHYSAKTTIKSNLNLYKFIQSRADLSIFTKMLQLTGYDSILSKSQTFTVWAPTDSALAGVNLNDTALVSSIVKNHITRFSYTTTDVFLTRKVLLMFDNKLLVFQKVGSGYTFGGKPIVKPDLATANGIVHILSQYVPYQMNFWEYISSSGNDLDSLRNYIKNLTVSQFDPLSSFQNGIFVDSIFKKTNFVMDSLAHLNVEDSTYTAILPSNAAWASAYNYIFPYFKTLDIDGGVSTQIANTQAHIVQDLFYKGAITLPTNRDSLTSTFSNKFSNPDQLFASSIVKNFSNGIGYVTSTFNVPPTQSWLKPLLIEAESANFKPTDLINYSKTIVSSIGTGYNVSGGYYLKADSKTESSISKLSVNFPLPNTLSTKYNIYCVFVPGTILNANDLRPNKVRFYLSYVDATGKQITNAAISSSNTVLTPTSSAAIFTSLPGVIDKKLVVQNFTFPYSNLLTEKQLLTRVALKVENVAGVTPIEKINFNRTLLIDCIILEPVQ